MNHAFHQDMVVIEPLPELQWGHPIGSRRLVYHGSSSGDDGGGKDSNDFGPNNSNNYSAVPSARVVGVDQPGRSIFVVDN